MWFIIACALSLYVGLVSVSRDTLRILTLEKLGTVFNQTKINLPYTPRKVVLELKVGGSIWRH